MKLSDDALVAVCLCTRLGRGEGVEPLTAVQWTGIVHALNGESPAVLLKTPLADFGVNEAFAERATALLRGLGSVGMELERLGSIGVWVMTRGDADYPRVWKRAFGPKAPPVLFGAGTRKVFAARKVAITEPRRPSDEQTAFVEALVALCVRDRWAVVRASGEVGIRIEPDSLERVLVQKPVREAVLGGTLTVVTPYLPSDRFTAERAEQVNVLVGALGDHHADAARPMDLPDGATIESVFRG